MLCGSPAYKGRFPNAPIIEAECLGATIRHGARLYVDGHIEVDEYVVDAILEGPRLASAHYVRTEKLG